MRSTEERSVLVIRSSAMGDVALTAPLLSSLVANNPDKKIFMLTRPRFSPLVDIPGVTIINAFYDGRHKGLAGLIRLKNDIGRRARIDTVIDLHGVLRSRIIGALYRMSGVPVTVIDKGRKERRALISGRSEAELMHITQRYAVTVARAGLKIDVDLPAFQYNIPDSVSLFDGRRPAIGVAPFAAHKLKVWPERHLVSLLNRLVALYGPNIMLFGGGKSETESMIRLEKMVPGVTACGAEKGLKEQISIMSALDLMITMDSANMHIAALAGIPVVSIWGATDARAGYKPLNSNYRYIAEISPDILSCRPCTIFGRGDCHRGDFACMEQLTPQMVLSMVEATGLIKPKESPQDTEVTD